MDATNTETPEMSIEEILAQLDERNHKVPVAAIQAARRQKDQVIPALIEVLKEATATAKEGKDPRGSAFFALFLLAEFRATEGLPAILDAISLPEEGPFEIFGDAIHETLPRVLVTLGGDRCTEICSDLLRNPLINEYVKWSAAKTLVMLVLYGLRPRQEIMDSCRQFLRAAIENDDYSTATSLICELIDLRPVEALEEIKRAFEKGTVDESIVDWESVQESLDKQPEDAKSLEIDPPAITDTLKELEHWASFSEPPPRPDPTPIWTPRPIPEPREPASYRPVQPVVRANARVGRNDPCPCGSGKKFKRCCGGRS